MKATETLEQEHRVIEQVASACGVCAEVLRRGAQVPADVLESIVDFFRQYGDRYHRQAEEALLSLLHEKGVPTGACPIVVINYENQKRTTLVDQLSSAVSAYMKSGGVVEETLINTLDALAEFFPDHIWKEDYLLLPMAEKVLSEERQALPGRFPESDRFHERRGSSPRRREMQCRNPALYEGRIEVRAGSRCVSLND